MALDLAQTENPNDRHSNMKTFETQHFQDRQKRQAAFASPKTVFISNFHNDTTQEEIRKLFSKFGTIDFDRMKKTDKKSFAWVTFTDEDYAKHAITAMNRTLNLGGQLHVEKFRDKSDFPHMREKTDANKNWIHFKINGVSKAVNHNKIQEMLGKFGKICKIRIMIDKFSPGYWVIFSAFDSMSTFTDFKNNCDETDFFKKGSLLKVTLDEFYLKDSTATRKIVEKSPRNVLTDQDKTEQNLSKLYGAKGTNLCVTGIPDFVKLGDFSSLVEACGPVVKLRMVNNKLRSGQLVAYVTYRDIESAEKFEMSHHKTDAFSWGSGVLLWVTKDWHDKKISRSNAAQAAVISEKSLKRTNLESYKSDIDPSLASYLKPNHNTVHSNVLNIVPPKLPHTPIMPLFQIPKRSSYFIPENQQPTGSNLSISDIISQNNDFSKRVHRQIKLKYYKQEQNSFLNTVILHRGSGDTVGHYLTNSQLLYLASPGIFKTKAATIEIPSEIDSRVLKMLVDYFHGYSLDVKMDASDLEIFPEVYVALVYFELHELVNRIESKSNLNFVGLRMFAEKIEKPKFM